MARGGESDWFARGPEPGLRFECTCCGNCCSGPTGFVTFTEEEGRAIATRLGIDYSAFIARYTREIPGGRSLNEVETEHGWDCVFLDRDSQPGKAVCSLYEARPTQCRTFPWWPEHVESPRSWQRLSRTCEGVGRGPVVPVSEIRISRARQIGPR